MCVVVTTGATVWNSYTCCGVVLSAEDGNPEEDRSVVETEQQIEIAHPAKSLAM